MATTQELQLPPFFVRNSNRDEGDAGNEAVQDFFLAWTLRCAANKYQNSNPKLYEFSRRIVYALIHGIHDEEGDYSLPNNMEGNQLPKDFQVLSVKTFRQIDQIDLYAEIEIEGDKKYLINIESKFYANITNGQLDKSKNILLKKYQDKDYSLINLVIYRDKEIILKKRRDYQEECRRNGYKFPNLETLGELIWDNNLDGDKTNNDLFDEFWFGGAFRPQ